jgi:hypothetical protein
MYVKSFITLGQEGRLFAAATTILDSGVVNEYIWCQFYKTFFNFTGGE